MRKGLALIALALAAAPSLLFAEDVVIGAAPIRLPAPVGFCELSSANVSENRVITSTSDLVAKAGNKLLGMSAECGQLVQWRAGSRLLDDFAQYQTPIAAMQSGASETIQETCATLRAAGDRILAEKIKDIRKHVEESATGVRVNETAFIGVLAEEPGACYAGMIQKLHTALNTEKTQVNLFAVTIVKGKNIFVYRFARYESADTVTATLTKIKADVAAMYAANR